MILNAGQISREVCQDKTASKPTQELCGGGGGGVKNLALQYIPRPSSYMLLAVHVNDPTSAEKCETVNRDFYFTAFKKDSNSPAAKEKGKERKEKGKSPKEKGRLPEQKGKSPKEKGRLPDEKEKSPDEEEKRVGASKFYT